MQLYIILAIIQFFNMSGFKSFSTTILEYVSIDEVESRGTYLHQHIKHISMFI